MENLNYQQQLCLVLGYEDKRGQLYKKLLQKKKKLKYTVITLLFLQKLKYTVITFEERDFKK